MRALSQRGFTALIKVAMQHNRLAVSTFAGPREEHGAERSITGRGGGLQGDNSRSEINVELGSCINQQHVWIRIKMVAYVLKNERIHN